MINWKVRLRNPVFWVTAIPALILLVQTVAAAFGVQLNLNDVQDKLLAIVEAGFAFLAVLGAVNDPTTALLSDSAKARTYEYPKVD